MKKAAGVAIATAAVGTAAYMAYSRMKPHAKRELKSNLGDVRQDMTEMARTLKDQMQTKDKKPADETFLQVFSLKKEEIVV